MKLQSGKRKKKKCCRKKKNNVPNRSAALRSLQLITTFYGAENADKRRHVLTKKMISFCVQTH